NKTELPFPVKAALVFQNQAQFNPLEFLSAIADNLKIYENTPVTKIADNIVYTENGTVTAENIVFACHYPFVNFPGLYFLRMSQERSYVVSSKWNSELKGMYIDAGKGLSFRAYEDEILIGGGAHRAGKADKSNPFDMLIKKGKMMFSDFNETARWSAQDCITLDGIPYIGRLSAAVPNIFVATGFNKWGMTSAMVGADIISDMICGRDTSAYRVFSPSRFSIFAVAKNLCTNTKETVKGFANHLKQANYKAEDVKTGTAKIVKYQGKKAGAYKDENGKLYIVSLTCPHLKCELQWNDATKTWDCPCHGSRYDYKGRLVDNPAQQNSILIN
ncbi:MAG: FAD-dependent oxidoreductase, partial [Eubacterium sp.]|nr:FAD-dependent oxidoreductase [Eubacterium sp.]